MRLCGLLRVQYDRRGDVADGDDVGDGFATSQEALDFCVLEFARLRAPPPVCGFQDAAVPLLSRGGLPGFLLKFLQAGEFPCA